MNSPLPLLVTTSIGKFVSVLNKLSATHSQKTPSNPTSPVERF